MRLQNCHPHGIHTPIQIMALVVALARTQQFWWFILHVLSVLFYVVYQLLSIFGLAALALAYYRYCLVMEITNYFIVLVQQKLKRGVKQLIANTNFHYFTLAAVFYLESLIIGPVNDVLFPYMIFLVFHIISYFQRHLIDFIGTLPQQQQLSSRVGAWLEENQPRGQIMAATAEFYFVLTLLNPIVVKPIAFANLMAGRWQVALAYLLFFAAVVVFLKLRWNVSPYMKQVVSKYDAEIGLSVQRFPRLANLYYKVRDTVVKVLAPITVTVPKRSPREQVQDSLRDSLRDASTRGTTLGTSR